jgi:peroxiredoxin
MPYCKNRKIKTRTLAGGGIAIVAALIVCLILLPAGLPASGAKPAKPPETASGAKPAPTPKAAPETLQAKAPDFVLKDLKGQRFRLSDHRGKRPVLIIFSATWCTFCKEEIPHFKAIHSTYTKQGLEIVNIDIQESQQKVAKFTADNKLPYRVLLDEDATVGSIYEIRGVPSMVLVDKKGMIVCSQCRNVESLIEAALK